MNHRHVEARTIKERDNADFPTEFAVRSGFRPEPDPFTGYTTRRTALYALAAIVVLALIFFAVLHWSAPR